MTRLPQPLPPPQPPAVGEGPQVALVDLLDRVLAGGVVISGEVTLCIDDIALVRISLRALVASIRAAEADPYPLEEARP
ncbi:gas vesicle protein [Peterkaempfera bronchialis]|uniref:Gas vesicle protein n=1 Tax=Peterkaempfera bronchialis TaxID=2126346 RepID=A0A345SVZ2_9ACTN|nr:gas vesicle protein [Peterkaempfera bronchialis]AXI77897.1 gas vesicle protein [Peterkaempfera bronchialis]